MATLWVNISFEPQPWKSIRVPVSPGMLIHEVARLACEKLQLVNSDCIYGLKAGKKELDLSLQVKSSEIYQSQKLVLYKRHKTLVKVSVMLVAKDRISSFEGSFPPSSTLYDVIYHFEDLKGFLVPNGEKLPIEECIIMSQTFDCLEQLTGTTLESLGVVSGGTRIRVVLSDNNPPPKKAVQFKGKKFLGKKKSSGKGIALNEGDSSVYDSSEGSRSEINSSTSSKSDIPKTAAPPTSETLEEIKRIYSLPLKERDVKIFEIVQQEQNYPETEESYELSKKELLNLIKWKKESDENSRLSRFIPKTSKESADLEFNASHCPKISVRIRVNDKYFINAEFNFLEKISALYELVKEYIDGDCKDIALITPPDIKLIETETFFSMGIRNRGLAFLQASQECKLKDKYLNEVQKTIPFISELSVNDAENGDVNEELRRVLQNNEEKFLLSEKPKDYIPDRGVVNDTKKQQFPKWFKPITH